MRVRILCVGRLRRGPEADLIDDYIARFDRTGRALSLGPVEIIEVEDRNGGKQSVEAGLLLKAIPDNAFLVALDERGKLMTSPEFSQRLVDWRDAGHRDLVFVIGGADGLTEDVRKRANVLLSFGKMVWPHMLARVMLTEQLYRAANILSGGPYHRD